ncbi:helix-hairpin-helix domain-containing protein [Pollutibacter soli]|uniref:helix-hairpin-helix domain-containing protein n=1 Tax=Pollutibacter soli TaxID=3034157 RepID=UPI0030140ABB
MSKKVKFILAAEIVANATECLLLGEFNNWDKENGFTLKKGKDGSFQTTVDLEEGRTYEYRYLLNDGRWVNDGNAQYYSPVPGLYVDNCVISVPAEAPKLAKTKARSNGTNGSNAVEKTTEDDFTKIEGIGKKIAGILKEQQILSFADLAKATPKKLKTILDNSGTNLKLADPASWPKQSKLAAAGKWEELKELQAELKGGKAVSK